MPRVHLSCLRCSGEICAYERQDVTGKGRWIFRQTWDLDCVPRRKVIQPYIGKKMKKGYAQLICKLDQRTQRSQWSMVFTGLCHALRSTKQECEEKMRDEVSTKVAIAKITTSCKTSPENVQSQKAAKVIGEARVFPHHMPVTESRKKPAVLKNSCPSLASPNLNEVLAKH